MVLHEISLKVNKGELVALIGPNGAGKTTLLKTIMGVIKPKNGEIQFDGRKISNLSPGMISKLGVGYVPQDTGTFPQMTVYENIEAGGYLLSDRNLVKSRIEQVLTLFPRLRERLNNKVFSLSGGERQMLLLGRALMLDPKLLLLDEPSLGLDPKTQNTLYSNIKALNESGKSVLLVEQNVQRALQVANRCYVQEVGRTVFEGSPSQLNSVEKIKSAYLGV
ncbi:MAG: ABC transporter ATP-binding protein [Thaumarchaeota archaeon]|nr:ABC transporter ATP-binding protein [Nitrososphaerota archaeon]